MEIVTKATAYFFSSDNDNEILNFFLFNLLITIFLVSPIILKNGFPFFSLRTKISLKAIPFEIPVPNALEKASFPANLFA